MTTDIQQIVLRLRTMRTIVWDFDGVIADTEPIQLEAFEIVAKRHGSNSDHLDPARIVGKSEPDIWQGLINDHVVSGSIDDLVRERSAVYLALAKSSVRPRKWVQLVLQGRPVEGNVIVSAGSYVHIDGLLEEWGIRSCFRSIECRDSPSWPGSKLEQLVHTLKVSAPPVALVEDVEDYLRVGRDTGAALTVGVRHSMNSISDSGADEIVQAGES